MSPEPEDLVAEKFDKLRGRLCGLIESWGLPAKQERAAVQTLKHITYDSQEEISKLL